MQALVIIVFPIVSILLKIPSASQRLCGKLLAMRYPIFILLLASFAYSQAPVIEPGVSHDLAVWRAAHYSDVRYKLNLTLEKMSPVLKGTIEIRLRVEEKRSGAGGETAKPESVPGEIATGFSTPIILDWRKLPGHEKDSTISNVNINGKSLAVIAAKRLPPIISIGALQPFPGGCDEINDHLIFGDGVVEGENVIKLDFTSPILTSGSAITRYVDKEDGSEYIYSLFVPSDASTAFPVFDQPDLKAKFELNVVAPKEWKIVSNGFLKYERDCFVPTHSKEKINCPIPEGMQDIGFAETKPISTYVFAFAAGPFERFDERNDPETMASVERLGKQGIIMDRDFFDPRIYGKPASDTVNVYVRKSQSEIFKPHAREVRRLNREAIKYLETYFDYKFPFPKYDLVLIPEFPFGGMEHAGATFLREDRVIFPQEPTKNDYITRANVIFHEAAHQWFGDTVTMKWFDDLWLKEGFAEFMAYKTLEKVMPEYNAWKVFYERNKQAAYLTDSTKGTTPIYQPIANLSAAKSAYGNIVYRKAPSFLKQAEFYLGPDKFQTAVRAFLKKHEFANADWAELVREFEKATDSELTEWAGAWITKKGLPIYRGSRAVSTAGTIYALTKVNDLDAKSFWLQRIEVWSGNAAGRSGGNDHLIGGYPAAMTKIWYGDTTYVFPNEGDYGYGIFLLDDKSRDYVLKNIQNEKDDFLRSMMWGSLWDSVREAELDPKDYVELVIKNIGVEKDETTIATLLNRVSTAMNYYMSEPPASAGGSNLGKRSARSTSRPPAYAGGSDLRTRLEELLLDKLQQASTPGQRITYYRAYVSIASTPKAHEVLKQMLEHAAAPAGKSPAIGSRTKDKFDIVTRLIILGDPGAPKLLTDLEKSETGDDAKRYAYAARAGISTPGNIAKYWDDFVNNKDLSESWIESAIGPFNSLNHEALTQQYLGRALAELPDLKRTRKIFFINNWLAAFIGGRRSDEALGVINKFLADNPDLDNDLRLKILENADIIERAVKIRARYAK